MSEGNVRPMHASLASYYSLSLLLYSSILVKEDVFARRGPEFDHCRTLQHLIKLLT